MTILATPNLIEMMNNYSPSGNSIFILIADDDPDDQELLGGAFHTLNNSLLLEFISNGSQVVSFLEKLGDNQLPSLIVLDYNMPELNGDEILGILNSDTRYSSITRVVWSTSNSEFYKNVCLALGAVDYIVKPSDIASFEKVAKYMLSLTDRE